MKNIKVMSIESKTRTFDRILNRNWLMVSAVLLLVSATAIGQRRSQETFGGRYTMVTEGPLTVQIQSPQVGTTVTQTGTPIAIGVMINNIGTQEVSGTVRLQVIDNWRVMPAGPLPFTVNSKGQSRISFTITASDSSYNAGYPVHAFVEFESEGKRMTAHPVLVLAVSVPNPPGVRLPVDWKPMATPVHGTFCLERLPIHRAGMRLSRDEVSVAAPPAATRAAAKADDRIFFEPGDGIINLGARATRGSIRDAISMQMGPQSKALYESVTLAVLEYPLGLAATQPLKLRFGTALGDATAGEGVIFRVRVVPFGADVSEAGTTVFERRSTSTVWEDGEADLSRFSGQSVRLCLECESGAHNTRLAYWAEPTLVSGVETAAVPFPPQGTANSRLLGSISQSGARYEVRLWPGRRGMLDAVLGFTSGTKTLYMNGFLVRVMGDALGDGRSAAELLAANEEPAKGHYRVRHHFRNWAGSFDLVCDMWIEKNALQTSFKLDNTPPARPWMTIQLEDIAAGAWSEHARRIYAGPGNVIEEPKAFKLKANGHFMSTSYVGFDFANGISMTQGVNDAVPDNLGVDPEARLYSLHTPYAQTMILVPSNSVWEGVKTWCSIHNPSAASGVPKLSGRFVFDLWGGRYASITESLKKAFSYGITDAVLILHRWQHWGYDYRLPDIYPPNTDYGTVEEFNELAAVCRQNKVLFAPHDNYNDFYSDAEGFSYHNIALTVDKKPQTAWMSGPVPSYHPRSDRVLAFVKRNIRLEKDGFNPGAYFIDVWSSEPPFDYYTEDGEFHTRLETRDVWREGFAWIRNYLGENAPQISEAGADLCIGWLDGGTAAMMGTSFWKIESQGNDRIPWFDMAYHDRFILNGAGYGGRYDQGQDSRVHGVYSDDYMTTEVLAGHPSMVAIPFGRDVVRKYWLMNSMARELAMKRMVFFEFVGDDIHRQHVRWDGGGEVWVNRGQQEWTVAGHILPEYGYYLRLPKSGGAIESAIERRDGQIVEWASSSGFVYVNARPVVPETVQQGGSGGGANRSGPVGPDPRLARMNPEGKPVSFNAVTSNGGFRLAREGDAVTLTPLPASIRFEARLRWKELPWKSAEPIQAEALDENGTVIGKVKLEKSAGELVLTCEPDVFAYRLR